MLDFSLRSAFQIMEVEFKGRMFSVEKYKYRIGGVALVLENVNKEPDDYF